MAITGLQHPTSPQKSLASNGNIIYVRRFQYARDDAWEADMPALGSFDATYGYFRGYRSTINGPYLIVELTYDTEGTVVNFAPGDGDTEYWAETRGDETPLEFSPNYLTKWNYNLYGKASKNPPTTANFPGGAAGYNAASDLADLNGNNLLAWSKGDKGTGWVLVAPKTKPGTEFFLRPTRVVFQRDYHRQQADAEAALQTVGTRILPAETFGSGGTLANWLCTDSNTVYDGKYWVTETSYKHSADGWDTDLYT
jgi:hypothetical protein